MDAAERTTAQLRASLRALSPGATLERGYAIAHLEAGVIVRDARQVPAGTAVTVTVAEARSPPARRARSQKTSAGRPRMDAMTSDTATDVADLSFEQARTNSSASSPNSSRAPRPSSSRSPCGPGRGLAARCEEWLLGAKRLLDAARPADADS
jgi:hypothetical protein